MYLSAISFSVRINKNSTFIIIKVDDDLWLHPKMCGFKGPMLGKPHQKKNENKSTKTEENTVSIKSKMLPAVTHKFLIQTGTQPFPVASAVLLVPFLPQPVCRGPALWGPSFLWRLVVSMHPPGVLFQDLC